MTGQSAWGVWSEGSYQVSENERPDPLAPPEGYGAKPPNATGYRGSGYPRPESCSAQTGGPGVFCGRPLMVIVWWGDLAEHLFPLGYCLSHYLAVSRLVRSHCTECGKPTTIASVEYLADGVWYDRASGVVQEAIDRLALRWADGGDD
jgi:hypothetical protein